MTDHSERVLKKLTIATRKSPLALWQAEFIRDEVHRLQPGIQVELLPMSTKGDKILDAPLAKVGGKGLFVKELEIALLDGRADIAVHSTKDVPMDLPEGLLLGVICQRADPYDALVFPQANTQSAALIQDLQQGAIVGTSSLRRQCQLSQLRPDLKFATLRGNVNTRLKKLDEKEFDAIILAAAGLRRLGFAQRISSLIAPKIMLPAVGQGALSIELRADDLAIQKLLQPLHHLNTALCVSAERAMNRYLNGGCQVPIAGFAQIEDGVLKLEGRVGAIDGSQLLIDSGAVSLDVSASVDLSADKNINLAENLGQQVARGLLTQGAKALLDEAYAKQ